MFLLTEQQYIELSYLRLMGFHYLVRNEIGSTEVFVAKPIRNKRTHNITSGGYDTWVERAYPMTSEEMRRRQNTKIGRYDPLTWDHEPVLIDDLLAFYSQANTLNASLSPESQQVLHHAVELMWQAMHVLIKQSGQSSFTLNLEGTVYDIQKILGVLPVDK